MKFNQKGFSDVIFMAIIGGIIGSLFITGVFVWMEIGKANAINDINRKLFNNTIVEEKFIQEEGAISVDRISDDEKIDLGDKYFADSNFIYKKYPMTGGFHFIKIEKADLNTFEVISEAFSKDANSVFHHTSVLEGADPDSFTFLDNGYLDDANIYQYYAKDKNNVFAFKRYIDNNWIIDGADPDTFVLLDKYIYQKDKNYAYYEGTRLESSNADSFEIIRHDDTVVTKDTNLFNLPGPNIAKDKNNVWFYENLIDMVDVDPDSFEILDCWYQKDKNYVYLYKVRGSNWFGEIIPDADPDTFEFMDCNYTKDKNAVYYEGEIIPDADPDTITFVETNYSKKTGPTIDTIFDKNNTSIYEKVGEWEYDRISRLFLYVKDKNAVYYEGEIIPDADPDTFELPK